MSLTVAKLTRVSANLSRAFFLFFNMETSVFGCKKETPSVDDRSFSLLKNCISDEVRDARYEIPEYTPVSNQLSYSSCASNATADSIEILLGVEGKKVEQLSRLFLYYNARLMAKEEKIDSGSYIKLNMSTLVHLGVCREDSWVYSENNLFLKPSLGAYTEANDNKISGYYRVDSTGPQRTQDVIHSISNSHPVVFGTVVGDDFTSLGKDHRICAFPRSPIGRHAMVVVGYEIMNKRVLFKVRNSWGKEWGSDGYCWFDSSYIENPETQDIWVPTLMEDIL